MRKILIISLTILLFLTSCYENSIMEYTPTIIDNGQYAEDLTYHVVSVVVPDGYEDIYYSTTTSSPTSTSSVYSPKNYIGSDSKNYEGILVKEGATIYAIGYKSVNGNAYSTFVSNLTIGVSKWDISIVDNGPYSEDRTKHIITISDSLWNGDIFYYSFSKYDEPSIGYRRYSYNVKEYLGVDSKKHKGVLVPAGDTIKAYSEKEINGGDYTSNGTEKLLNQWTISIVDNGPSLDDNDKRIVSIVDPTYSSNDIYYTLDGSTPTALSTKYTPAEYQGTDSQTYVGVLLPEATTVKAVADRIENEKKVTSFTSEITTAINKWDINIIDRGESIDDNTKRIVSIEDTKWNGNIFYTVNGTELTYWREEYSPSNFECIDGNIYEGILVDEASTVEAYSYVCENKKTQNSNVVGNTIGINPWTIKIVDNGQYSCDKSKRIVEIIDLKWNGDIYYSSLSNLSEEPIKYIESEYVGSDNITYKGVIVPEATSIQAFSKYNFNGETTLSNVSEKLFDTNLWSIDMIDNGQLYNDENIHILSIIDDDRQGNIYYTLDGSTPTNNSLLYEPSEYEGVDSKTYSGVLVSQDDVVNAISYQNVNGISVSSIVCKIYKIGDTGPAGGFVFYDKGYRSDGWRYLEAAPSDLNSGYNFGGSEELIGTQNKVGTGKSNTQTIMEKLGNEASAVIACSDYSYNDYNDWFLPSLSELWFMCTNLHNKGLGNFKDSRGYLSSSEYSEKSSCVWIQWFTEDCYQDWINKEYSWNIRPARSF